MSAGLTFSTPSLLNTAYLPAKMNAVALNSSDVYVAVGDNGKFMKSADGTSWGVPLRMGGASSTANMNAVIANGATFLAVGTDSVTGYAVCATSADGTTWTTPAAMSGTPTVATMTSVAYASSTGVYVAVGYNAANLAMYSISIDDGSTWTTPGTIGHPTYSRLHSITANSAGLFIAVGTDNTYPFYGVYDSGLSAGWTIFASFTTGGGSLNSIIVNSSGLFVAVGSSGPGICYTTEDGEEWSNAIEINSTTTMATLTSVILNSSGNYIAIGYNSSNLPVYATSTLADASIWTGPMQIGTATGIMKSIILNPAGTGFLAIGNDLTNNAVYATSTDGNTWSDQVMRMISAVNINSIVVDSAGLIVGVGTDGNGYSIYTTSSDGYNWSIPVMMENEYPITINSVAVNPTRTNYMAVGNDVSNYPMYSLTTNPTTWNSPSQISSSINVSMKSVCYVNYQSDPVFLAVGHDTTNSKYSIYNIAASSWSEPAAITSSSPTIMNSVTANSAGLVVAVGQIDNGKPAYARYNMDTSTWTAPSAFPGSTGDGGEMNSIAVNSAGIFVAVGTNGSSYPIFSRSTDGSNWSTPATMNGYSTAVNMNSVTVSSRGLFVAVGSINGGTIIYSSSSDGSSWSTPTTISGYTQVSQLNSVAVKSSGLFVAVGTNSLGFPIYTTATARPPCFLEGTTILCHVNGKEAYLPIENVKPGMLVKTSLNGFKKVKLIGKRLLENPGTDERIQDRLYKCSVKNYPELKEDLYITGCHSILVDTLTEKQREDTMKSLKDIFVTDQKYRLIAFLDERAEPWNSEGEHMVWHLALEHENVVMNYGVYVNGGLLVETASIKCMVERAKMELQSQV